MALRKEAEQGPGVLWHVGLVVALDDTVLDRAEATQVVDEPVDRRPVRRGVDKEPGAVQRRKQGVGRIGRRGDGPPADHGPDRPDGLPEALDDLGPRRPKPPCLPLEDAGHAFDDEEARSFPAFTDHRVEWSPSPGSRASPGPRSWRKWTMRIRARKATVPACPAMERRAESMEVEMRRLTTLFLAAVVAATLAAPVAAGRPGGAGVTQSACFFSRSDADGTWPGLRVTVDWSRQRVDRIASEVHGWTAGYTAVVASDDHVLARAQRSGSYTVDLWPMKYWYDVSWDQPARWATATFDSYRVKVSSGSKVLLDYDSFFAGYTPSACP